MNDRNNIILSVEDLKKISYWSDDVSGAMKSALTGAWVKTDGDGWDSDIEDRAVVVNFGVASVILLENVDFENMYQVVMFGDKIAFKDASF